MRSALSTLTIGATLLGATFQIIAVPTALVAGPRACWLRTYYQEPAKATVVGTRTNCPGGQASGRTSRYFEVEIVRLDDGPRPGGHGGPGSLPCEFLAQGCSVFPTRRGG